MIIKPTVGRVLWYHPSPTEGLAHQTGQPLASMVTRVWSDTCVNLVVFDANGDRHARTSVLLVQEGADRPDCCFAEWMPYQIGKAREAAT